MADDLPELIDVSVEATSASKRKDLDDENVNKAEKEDEFKLVISKRKRRQSKMEVAEGDDMEADLDDEDLGDEDEQLEQMDKAQSEPLRQVKFPPISAEKIMDGKFEMRKIHVPPNRFNPLKENWMKIYEPVVNYLKLQIRFNLKSRNVELRVRRFLFYAN